MAMGRRSREISEEPRKIFWLKVNSVEWKISSAADHRIRCFHSSQSLVSAYGPGDWLTDFSAMALLFQGIIGWLFNTYLRFAEIHMSPLPFHTMPRQLSTICDVGTDDDNNGQPQSQSLRGIQVHLLLVSLLVLGWRRIITTATFTLSN